MKKIQATQLSEVSFRVARILFKPYAFLPCPNLPSMWGHMKYYGDSVIFETLRNRILIGIINRDITEVIS